MANSSKAEVVRALLIEHIVSGAIAPGTRLDEVELADWFDVSRTPVREALRHVAAIGLAAYEPHKGSVVATPDPGTLAELFEAALELECVCVRLAAEAMTAEQRAELVTVYEQGAPAGVIRTAVGNGRLKRVTEDTLTHLFLYWRMLVPSAPLPPRWCGGREVIEAVAAGRGEIAATAMRRHLDSLRPG
jgi:DNA-binding GntR family transcriptional regulator